MGLLTPYALTFAALSIPILILYMLRLRRRDVLVSSTLLWQRLLRDREANTPWQRLRRNLLLLLQLLVLALLTVALARPFVPAPTVVSGSVVLLLDGSASMQARDVPPTRFDAARQAAREIVAGLGPGDLATLVAVGPQPQVLASRTSDRALLRRALDGAAPTDGPADWEAAFALAAAGLTGEGDVQVVLISDGALPESLPPLPGEVRFVGVGGGSGNLSIAALATREGAGGAQAFLRIVNYGDVDAEPLVELYADGALFDARRLPVPARASADLTLTDLPYDLRVLQARLDVEDALPLDDAAWAVHAPPASGRVLLVSGGNLFLERALGALPGVELERLLPGSVLPPSQGGIEGGYDLIVYDGPITGTLPAGNLWLIGPSPLLPPSRGESEGGVPSRGEPEGGGGLDIRVGGFFTATAITRVAAADPLLRYVDLDAVHVLRARAVEPPPGARVLVEAGGGPLLFVAERPEGRLAVLAFDLHDSDLPLHVAFPVLTANLVDWLLVPSSIGPSAQGGMGRASFTAAIRPGDPVPVQPDPEAAEIAVTAPDGTRHVLPVGEATPTFAATGRLGVYRVEQSDRAGNVLRSSVFAVNLFDQAESNIAPRDVVQVGRTEVRAAADEEEGRQEFWSWLAGAALVMLATEWWVYQRGQWVRFRTGVLG